MEAAAYILGVWYLAGKCVPNNDLNSEFRWLTVIMAIVTSLVLVV